MNKKQIIILCAVIAFVFAAGAAGGTYLIMSNSSRDEIYVAGEKYDRLLKFFELDDVADLVDQYYYKQMEPDELVQGSLEGFMTELGDGYSRFYPEEYFKYFDENTEGSYMGLGMLVDKDEDTGYIVIKRVFADTAAYDANLVAGNLIVTIDGMETRDMDAECAVSCLRGADGTEIALKVLAGETEMDVSFVRKAPDSQVVFTDMLESAVGYIDIAEFSGSSVSDFKDAVATVTDEGAKFVIIDIRDCPGGYISQASEIADMLLSQGEIYYTEGKDGEKFIISATEETSLSLPVALLINENTKGVAEVFAAALKENGRATLIGENTYGKGVVLTTLAIPNSGDGIRLVTAHYYSPEGAQIDGSGVAPDVVTAQLTVEDMTAENDMQLQKAIELLSGE